MSGLAIASALLAVGLQSQERPYKPCGVELRSLSRRSGAPGDIFAMTGQWGDEQGAKLPVINKGGSNRLDVVSWSPSEIRVRIPRGLHHGEYRVGVYCNDLCLGGAFSSGFMDFEVLPAAREAPAGDAQAPVDALLWWGAVIIMGAVLIVIWRRSEMKS